MDEERNNGNGKSSHTEDGFGVLVGTFYTEEQLVHNGYAVGNLSNSRFVSVRRDHERHIGERFAEYEVGGRRVSLVSIIHSEYHLRCERRPFLHGYHFKPTDGMR